MFIIRVSEKFGNGYYISTNDAKVALSPNQGAMVYYDVDEILSAIEYEKKLRLVYNPSDTNPANFEIIAI